MNINELKEQIKAVAQLRVASGTLGDKLKELRELWESEHKNFLESVANGKEAVAEAEDKLRELTLQAYAETGDKAPAVGVGIRELTVLTYDNKIALDWAKAHKMALKLDTEAFKKIAKADPPDFVKITTEPQATIATNLQELPV